MRHLVFPPLVLALCGLLGCGDSAGPKDPKPDSGGGRDIVYPDSLCTETECVANLDKSGTCDPNASDPALADCTAWRIDGTFSFAAVKIDQAARRGRPRPPVRTDDDACPPNSKTPAGKTQHCCERVLAQPAKPAFVLTGITLNSPPVFKLDNVSNTNKTAIEDDRYNWVMELSGDQPGDVVIKSGLGLQNEDGSFAFAEGPFELGGKTWNQRGEWDPHIVEGVLGADGTLKYKKQYVPGGGRSFELPLWGQDYKFTMMVLALTGIEMDIKLSDDKLCGGYLTGNMVFNQTGKITSYLPLGPLRDVELRFTESGEGISLCQLTASLEPGECKKPVSEWGK